MSSATVSKKTYVLIWVALMILLLLTWGLAKLNLGLANTVAAMLIAIVKMLLVILFFMHVRYNSKLTWIFAGAGFVWFLIMVVLTMNDYLTRGLVRPENKTISYWQNGVPTPAPGKSPGEVKPDGNR
jgi:cytochrome c oxidase subunit 4